MTSLGGIKANPGEKLLTNIVRTCTRELSELYECDQLVVTSYQKLKYVQAFLNHAFTGIGKVIAIYWSFEIVARQRIQGRTTLE